MKDIQHKVLDAQLDEQFKKIKTFAFKDKSTGHNNVVVKNGDSPFIDAEGKVIGRQKVIYSDDRCTVHLSFISGAYQGLWQSYTESMQLTVVKGVIHYEFKDGRESKLVSSRETIEIPANTMFKYSCAGPVKCVTVFIPPIKMLQS